MPRTKTPSQNRFIFDTLVLLSVVCLIQPLAQTAPKQNPPTSRQTSLAAQLLRAIQKGNVNAVRQLLASGTDANARDEAGRTPIMHALDCCGVSAISLPIVQALIDKGANLNAKDNVGTAALQYAIYSESVPAVKLLISRGANVNALEQYGQFPLQRAVAMGNLPIVEVLLRSGAKMRLQKQGEPLLATAANTGNVEIAKRLVAKGLNVNERDQDGGTALIAAAQAGHAAMVKFLLGKGAQVNQKDAQGETALSKAATFGTVEVARLLLEKGADANLADGEGSTPLVSAVISSMGEENADLVKLLLDHGAKPDGAGQTTSPLIWAAKNGSRQAVELLLAKGAKVTERAGESALMGVLREGNQQRMQLTLYGFGGVMTEAQKKAVREKAETDDAAIVKALLAHGVEVTKGANRLALIDAAAGGNSSIIQILLDSGAPVNIDDSSRFTPELAEVQALAKANPKEAAELLASAREMGLLPENVTPLMMAAKNGHPLIPLMLLEKGADPHARDRQKKTALMYVAGFGRSAIVRQLPQMREGILHRANEGVDKPVSSEVTPKEMVLWKQWALEGDRETVQVLIEAKADVNARDIRGHTALMEAAMQSDPSIVQLLIEAKADVNARDNLGQTALMQVVENGRLKKAPELYSQELQNNLVSLERVKERGNVTAATIAKAKREVALQKSAVIQDATALDSAVIRLLIEAGADVKAVDKKGRTALQIAEKTHLAAIAALLR